MQLTIDISDDVITRLNRLSEAESTSRDALLEQALVPFLEQCELRTASQKTWRDYFGALKSFPEDGLEFQNRIRSEWDRELW